MAFLLGQYYAPKIKNNQKYNMKFLFALIILWIVEKFLWTNAPSKIEVFFYMLLGIIGVFVWPILFEKIKLNKFRNQLKKVGAISLELYLTNIYINALFGQIGSPFNWLGITDPYNVGRYFFVLILGIWISFFVKNHVIKRRGL